MKKKITAILLTITLLVGCEAAPATTPDIETIVQQLVEKAIAQYEEEQKEKDDEIAELKAQLEEFTSQTEEAPMIPNLQKPPPPQKKPQHQLPASRKSRNPSRGQGRRNPSFLNLLHYPHAMTEFDLKNLYPAFMWENFQPIEEDYTPYETWEQEYGEDDYEDPPLGTLLEDDALEVIRLTNLEGETHGLGPLEIDYDLMALAEIRAEEASIKYSYERPDGTRVSQMGYFGENLGAKASVEKQVASWMGSEGHRTNILREQYHRIGVGCYLGGNGKR